MRYVVIDFVTDGHNLFIGEIGEHLLHHPLLFINEALRVLHLIPLAGLV
jgi:hypothetical protein